MYAPGLKTYIIKRLLSALPTILVVIVINFALIHAAPYDPALMLVGEAGYVSKEYVARIRAEYGLDKSLPEQLLVYILKVVNADFGYSYFHGEPVLRIIAQAIPATLLLMATAFTIAILIGIVFGIFSARKPNSMTDILFGILSTAGYSMPRFLLATLVLWMFSLNLGWFPSGGVRTVGGYSGSDVVDVLTHLCLPALTLATYDLALVYRLTRTSMLDTLAKDYIITARSKGLSEKTVLFKHALRNAIAPVVTTSGVRFGLLLAGAVTTETVFNWPGMGRLIYEATLLGDYPLLMGTFVVICMTVIISNLLVDIIYGILDPRVRLK
ncbi:MAG: ABC transporter permease [Candidatus Bathyarchaeota archaeon]|nr:ABC transporter permease [Candidatus Bathyarchaeota archaeon]MDH5745341.1 ABC transporter permease [Candidatus Bathyarchaeota archaeon]